MVSRTRMSELARGHRWGEEKAAIASDPGACRYERAPTALHIMLKRGTASEHFEMLVAAGARGDILDEEGRTVIDMLRRKREPVWRGIAERLRRAS